MRKHIFSLCITIGVLSSCGGSDQTPASLETETYFDIKGFFEEEAHRLTKDGTPIHKEIARNKGEKEAKTITIKDWQKELSLFIESDINKPAWTSSYAVTHDGDDIVYTSVDEDLRTKKIIVEKKGDDIESITIHNEVMNQLYQSQEKLYYSPDSLYRIEKVQDIRVIGTNHYLITGQFK